VTSSLLARPRADEKMKSNEEAASGPKQPMHFGPQILQLERFGDEAIRPKLQPALALYRRASRRHHQNFHIRKHGIGADVVADLIARHFGKHDVQQHKVGMGGGDPWQGIGTRGHAIMAEPFAKDQIFQRSGDVVFILDNQNAGGAGHSGPLAATSARGGLVRAVRIGKAWANGGTLVPDLPSIALIQSQLLDPLRIGLIVGLVITMYRTRTTTGTLLPLALGVAFVAVILPVSNPKPDVTLVDAALAGLVSNLVILAIVLGLSVIVRRLRG